MTASSVGPVPVSPPALPRQPATQSRSPFSALFSGSGGFSDDNTPPIPSTKKQKDDAVTTVAVPVQSPPPVPPKLILSVALPNVGEDAPQSPAEQDTTLSPETIELPQTPQSAKPVAGEIAFAAKLIEAVPQTQLPVQATAQPPAQNQAVAPPSTPLPAASKSTATADPTEIPAAPKPAETAAAAPERVNPRATPPVIRTSEPQAESDSKHESAEPSPLPVQSLSQSPAPHDTAVSPSAPPSIEAPPEPPAIDHVASRSMPASAVNEITVRIGTPDQSSASVHVVDRSGELHVAVRASDPVLADSLRGNVEQLTSRLNNSGWSAEVWKPQAITAAARTQSPSQQMSQGQEGAKGQSGTLQYQNQQNKKQKYPDWVEEFYANNE